MRPPWLIIAIWFVATLASLAASHDAVQLYRALQAEIEGTKYGAPAANIKGFITLPFPRDPKTRSIVIVPVGQIDSTIIQDMQQPRSSIEAFLLVLPRNFDRGALSDDETSKLELLEEALLSSRLHTPVFATTLDSHLELMIEQISSAISNGKIPSASNGGYEVTISGDYPKDVVNHQVVNFAATFNAAQIASGAESRAPTIIVTAFYDSSAAIPSLAFGADSNGSGVIVLLQLMRLFRRLYHSTESRGRYNIVFLLTGGGHLNFEGVQQWLNDVDASKLEDVEFALCLDTVGGAANGLYLHYSKPPKDEGVAKFYNAIERAGEVAGVKVTQVHKKVNVASSLLAWEHEQFSKRRILAATLSALPSSPPPLQRSSLTDTKSTINLTSLHLATKVVGEALAHLVYPEAHPDMQLVNLDRSESSAAFSARWLDLLASHSRMLPFYPGLHKINAALLQFFRDHSDESTQQAWTVDSHRFRFANDTSASLSTSLQHSLLVDAVFLLINMTYLALLFTVLRVATRGWGDFLSIFKAAPKRHAKRS